MGKSRKKYSLEFKLEAVRQAVERGRMVSEVAEGLGVNASVVSRWKAAYATAGVVTSAPANQEQRDSEAENRRLRREFFIAR